MYTHFLWGSDLITRLSRPEKTLIINTDVYRHTLYHKTKSDTMMFKYRMMKWDTAIPSNKGLKNQQTASTMKHLVAYWEEKETS